MRAVVTGLGFAEVINSGITAGRYCIIAGRHSQKSHATYAIPTVFADTV